MPLVSVAVEYIEIHRKGSSDVEIARALKDQGFSDETLTQAFRAAGERPEGSAPPAGLPLGRRMTVGLLVAVSAAAFIASALLFVRNFSEAGAAAPARAAR